MIESNTRRLLLIQVVIAVTALAITAYSLYELGPLSRRQAELKADIAVLEAKRNELQRDNEALTRVAKPVNKSLERVNVNAWLYVGRLSDGRWAPLSEGVAPIGKATSVNEIKGVLTKKEARLIGRVDNTDTPPGPGESVQFVKSDTQLSVLELKTQPSKTGGMQVWARVSVPTDRILEIQSP